MKRNLDEIIELSINEEFGSIDCPDPEAEVICFSLKLKKRKKLIYLKKLASICAIVVFIPLILIIYAARDNSSSNKNIIVERTKESLVTESSVIVFGIVKSITPIKGIDRTNDIEVSIEKIFKGIPNKEVIFVRVDDTKFEINEEVILFLASKEKGKKYYTLEGSCLGKYTLKDPVKRIFTNCDESEEIYFDSLENEILIK